MRKLKGVRKSKSAQGDGHSFVQGFMCLYQTVAQGVRSILCAVVELPQFFKEEGLMLEDALTL